VPAPTQQIPVQRFDSAWTEAEGRVR